MSSNVFGELFRVTTFGESHGPGIGVVVDGVPPRLRLDLDHVTARLRRRRPGQSDISSARQETEEVEVLSGLFEGQTTGAPLAMFVRNRDARPGDYDALRDVLRPGHAEAAWLQKYGIRDHRGGGRASGRETVARVMAGAVAEQILAPVGVSIRACVVRIGDVVAERRDVDVEANPVRCPDAAAAEQMVRLIEAARAEGDSVGGSVEVIADGVPAGLGDPVFGKLDARLAGALMGIGSVKGVEIGDGFALTRMRGSEANDPLSPTGPQSNRSGGILGGVSSGAPIVVRVAVKPTPSIARPQRTVTVDGEPTTVSIHGRHDPCIAPRIVPVVEAMTALVLVDALFRQRAVGGPF